MYADAHRHSSKLWWLDVEMLCGVRGGSWPCHSPCSVHTASITGSLQNQHWMLFLLLAFFHKSKNILQVSYSSIKDQLQCQLFRKSWLHIKGTLEKWEIPVFLFFGNTCSRSWIPYYFPNKYFLCSFSLLIQRYLLYPWFATMCLPCSKCRYIMPQRQDVSGNLKMVRK